MEVETEEEVVHARGAVHGGELHPCGLVGETHLLQHQHAVFHIHTTGNVVELRLIIQRFLDGGVHVDIHPEWHNEGRVTTLFGHLLGLRRQGIWCVDTVYHSHQFVEVQVVGNQFQIAFE